MGGRPARALTAGDGAFNATTEGLTGAINTAGLAPASTSSTCARRRGRRLGRGQRDFLNIGTGGGGGGTVAEVESNNTRGTAQVITPNPATVNGTMTPGDNDYFAVTVAPGRTLSATLTPPANGDYDLYLYRAAPATPQPPAPRARAWSTARASPTPARRQ